MHNVPSVLIAATSQEDGQVVRRMRIRIPQVAAKEHGRGVQQIAVTIVARGQFGHKATKRLDNFRFNALELTNLGVILAMMRQIVMVDRDALHLWDRPMVVNHHTYHTG